MKQRKLYNFKKANWKSLNLELSHINWKKVICHKDIHTAWRDFKFVLNYSVKKYIPTITSKSRNQPPWYDSEMHHLNLRKNRLHRKAMHGTEMDKENYRQCRREFKSKIENKIQSNLDINTNKGDISKKFWAHVKATAKSTRIPETVNYKNTYSSKSKNKADLFNSFFYDQFSSPSKYNINIHFNSTREPHINMSTEMVYDILKKISIVIKLQVQMALMVMF